MQNRKLGNHMELRYIEEVETLDAIVHIVDQSIGGVIQSKECIQVDEILNGFIPEHVTKVLGDYENQKAVFDFTDEENPVRACVGRIIAGGDFVTETAFLAERLYKATEPVEGLEGFDVLFARIQAEDQVMLAILKLDYQTTYIHEVDYSEEGVRVGIVSQQTALPTMRQRLSNCAIILPPGEFDYDMLLLNRKGKDVEGNTIDYFMNRFFAASPYKDDTTKTIELKKTMEKWMRQTIKNDAVRAYENREVLHQALAESAVLNVDELVDQVTDSNDEKSKLEEKLELIGISPKDSFEVDVKWREKKLKQKQIKTDTGFVLKAEKDFFDDKMRFEVITNGDGTVTYVIKNVRNIFER